MRILKLLLLLFLGLNFSGNIFSQEKIDEKAMKAEKVAFITDRIGLTVKEAQDFWPIFNEFDEKMNDFFDNERHLLMELEQKSETLSEKELTEKIDKLISIKIERANLEKEFHEKYKKVLSAKKVALFYQSNKEFRKHLMKKYGMCKQNQ
ncbi:hypothetical protein LJC11_01145 [Bacteroidales bacterium OttesenSCG-928-I21]|nr:hypothetical protein [Bacteroidales bacterium OttesenSCG-928-I21]